MGTINIHKSNLSYLIEKALKGEKIIKSCKRIGGQFKGKVWMAKDFDVLPGKFMKYFK